MPRNALRALVLGTTLLTLVAAAPAGEFPDAWYFYGGQRPAGLKQLEGLPAPELALSRWVGEPAKLDELEGKVVVIDFWATWCGPCVRAIPKNVELVRKHGKKRLAFIGVHDSRRGAERIGDVSKRMNINYPLAVDDGGKSVRAYNLRFWPTYVVVDQAGVVRAAGLLPDRVGTVVDRLLAEGDPAAGTAAAKTNAAVPDSIVKTTAAPAADDPKTKAIPAAWLEGGTRKRMRLRTLERADAPPPVASSTWINSEPLDLESLKGKVVLLDFWATWCGPCLASVPKMNQLHEQYADDLVIVGICHPRGADKMPSVVAQRGIRYPVCTDAGGRIGRAYAVDSYPDYYFIDRQGRLRIADCANRQIEEAIRMLVAEPPPAAD